MSACGLWTSEASARVLPFHLVAKGVQLKTSDQFKILLAVLLLLGSMSFTGTAWAVEMLGVSQESLGANSCSKDDGELECSVTFGFRAIELHAIGDEVIARFERPDGSMRDEDVIVLSSHLEDLALNEHINLEEVPVLFLELQRLAGARYEIPQRGNEIKTALGFAEEAPIAAADWYEILKVHVERTLSTIPSVSDLVLDLLKVSTVVRVEEPSPATNGLPPLNPVVVETNGNALAL